MKLRLRKVGLPLAAAALAVASLGASPASSQNDPLLPALTADEVLALAGVDAPPEG